MSSSVTKNSTPKPIPERNEKGHYFITQKYCSELSEYNGYYYYPEMNANLHLHYKGFTKIENLEAFVNIKVLYLENNCLQKIENLSHMKHLSCLYLNNNFISTIENLDENTNLSILNLSSNRIKKIENLGKLDKLGNLYIDKNLIDDVESIRGVLECQSISVFDIQNNSIENGQEELIKILNQMSNLRVLYLKGNPVTRNVPYYRKTLIKEIEHLSYLDDRPIDQGDREASLAFFTGGLEAERKVRDDYRKSKDIGMKVRAQQTEMMKEPFEERRQKALQSLRTEYIARKETLENKKRKLLRELEENSDNLEKKAQISRELLSIDYQASENEKFKIKEEEDVYATISKRENVDRFASFEYEDWMQPILETHTIENLFDFSTAVKLIRNDLKTRGVRNWELFNELDLRSKWTEIELNLFRNNEINDYSLCNLENSKQNYLSEKNSIQIKEDIINENDYSDFAKLNTINTTTFISQPNTKVSNEIFAEEEIVTTYVPSKTNNTMSSFNELD